MGSLPDRAQAPESTVSPSSEDTGGFSVNGEKVQVKIDCRKNAGRWNLKEIVLVGFGAADCCSREEGGSTPTPITAVKHKHLNGCTVIPAFPVPQNGVLLGQLSGAVVSTCVELGQRFPQTFQCRTLCYACLQRPFVVGG